MQTYPFDSAELARTVNQPPLAELAERAARRVRRRRSLASAAAVGMTALVAVGAVPVVRGVGPFAPPPGAGGRGSYLTSTAVLDRNTVVSVRYGECAAQFSVTTDQGRTWSPYRGPVQWRPDCGVPVDTSYRLLGPRVFAAEVAGVRYLTRDAGVTWHREDEVVRVGHTVPPHARDLPDVPDQFADPLTGGLYRLDTAGAPGDGGTLRRAPDGTLWTLIPDGTAGVPKVGRSADSGQSWRWSATYPGLVRNALLVAAGPTEAYVLGDCPEGTVVYRTDDGGESWFSTPVAWEAAEVATVNAAGDLLVGTWERAGSFAIWVSRDGGRSFTKGDTITVPEGPTVGTADGRIWVAAGNGWAATSTDGWWRVTDPRRG